MYRSTSSSPSSANQCSTSSSDGHLAQLPQELHPLEEAVPRTSSTPQSANRPARRSIDPALLWTIHARYPSPYFNGMTTLCQNLNGITKIIQVESRSKVLLFLTSTTKRVEVHHSLATRSMLKIASDIAIHGAVHPSRSTTAMYSASSPNRSRTTQLPGTSTTLNHSTSHTITSRTSAETTTTCYSLPSSRSRHISGVLMFAIPQNRTHVFLHSDAPTKPSLTNSMNALFNGGSVKAPAILVLQ